MVTPIQSAGGSGGSGTLAGDVSGPALGNTVGALQGFPLDLATLAAGQVLQYDGTDIIGGTASGSFQVTNVARVDPTYGDNLTGALDDLSKPFETVQAAIDAAALSPSIENYVILLPPVLFESVTIPAYSSISILLFAPVAGRSDWYGASGTPTITMDAASGSCATLGTLISGIGAPALLASGNGSQFFGAFQGGFERDGNTTDLAVDATGVAVIYENAGIASGAYSHIDCPIVVFNSTSVPDALGPFTVIGNTVQSLLICSEGRFNSIDISGDVAALILGDTVIFGALTTTSMAPSSAVQFSGNAGAVIVEPVGLDLAGCQAETLIVQSSTSGAVVVDAKFCTIRDTIDIGDDVQLILNGATYNPDGVTIPGTGRYSDTVGARVRAVPATTVGASYAVQPRDALVSGDNSAGTVALALPPVSESGGGPLVIAATDDPSINAINVTPNGSDTIGNNPGFDLDTLARQRVTLVADTLTNNWVIADIYPGVAAPAPPLAFPTDSGASYTLTTLESGVVMTDTGARTVNFPAGVVPDGTTFVVVDGAGTAASAAITVNPSGGQTINGAPADSITSNFASVTYRFSAGASNWSKI